MILPGAIESPRILTLLKKVKPWGQDGRKWSACCPVHEDNNPSLLLWLNDFGWLSCRCLTCGARREAVAAALGVRLGLFAPAVVFPVQKGEVVEKKMKLEQIYTYCDEAGKVRYQVLRYEGKQFRQRQPDPSGQGWIWNLDKVEPLLYRLPDLLTRPDEPVFVLEGEKDVETLFSLKLLATTNSGGAGQWLWDFGAYFHKRRVCVIPDQDEPGAKHAAMVAGSILAHEPASIRVCNLHFNGSPAKDVTEFVDMFPDPMDAKKHLLLQVRACVEYVPVVKKAS